MPLAANGGFTYTPAPGYFGPDSFTYTVTDHRGLVSNAATASITVNGPALTNPFTLTVMKSGSGAGTVSSVDTAINCGASCSKTYNGGTAVTLNAVAGAGSVFTGWSGPCIGTGACNVTINATTTAVATFALTTTLTNNRILDIDNNGSYDALTDGLLVIRYLFGLSGPSLITNAVAAGAPRSDAAIIETYLTDIRPMLDIDGNGQSDALTDGLMVIRYLFGLRGDPLILNATGAGVRTTAAQIEPYIQSLMP